MRLAPHDPAYPQTVLELANRPLDLVPPAMTVSGPLDAAPAVAIVGSREADRGATDFARELAYQLARVGVVVVSGGALGIDAAAHRGAMDADGATWVVACHGSEAAPYPEAHRDLFNEVAASERSRMIWPFLEEQPKTELTPRARNGVLVALTGAVVVIQARVASGSLNAANWARRLGRRLYVVPGTPWDPRYRGSLNIIAAGGGTPLWSVRQLFDDLDLPAGRLRGTVPQPRPVRHLKEEEQSTKKRPRNTALRGPLTDQEKLVFSNLSAAPLHQDKIIAKAGLGASSTLTALLTLSLKDVVVEGPDGFFRRKPAQ